MNEYDWELFKDKIGVLGRGMAKGIERVGQSTGDYWSEFNKRYEATNPSLIDKVGVSLNPILGFGSGVGKWADAAKDGFPPKETAIALASVAPAVGYTKVGTTLGAAKNLVPTVANDWVKTFGMLGAGTAGTTAADEALAAYKKPNYGSRPDGTKKGVGYFGELPVKGGGVATEYSISSDDVVHKGKNVNFPTLVPTLSKEEVDQMVNDIIPNKKRIPDSIYFKAVDHANERIKSGLSPYAD